MQSSSTTTTTQYTRTVSGGDGLVNKWLDDAHSIAKDDQKVQSERARVDVTAAWAPYRSVGYLLINAAKGATPESVLA